MQNKPSKNQHRNVYYRLRRSDPHERLSARLRRFSFGAAVFFVMAAAGIVTYSLYQIQIEQGATFWTAPFRRRGARSTMPPASRWPLPA